MSNVLEILSRLLYGLFNEIGSVDRTCNTELTHKILLHHLMEAPQTEQRAIKQKLNFTALPRAVNVLQFGF